MFVTLIKIETCGLPRGGYGILEKARGRGVWLTVLTTKMCCICVPAGDPFPPLYEVMNEKRGVGPLSPWIRP